MRVINFHCHPPYLDPSIGHTEEAFEEVMRSAEVDYFCMSPIDFKLPEDPEYPFMSKIGCSTNEIAARLRDRFPEKVIPFVYVDPRDDGAAETVVRWVRQEGFRGLKLYPPLGFYPDAPELVEFFQTIDELTIPILFHAGRVAPHPSLRCKFADPRYLEGVAFTARRCSVVVGHAGNPWKDVAFAIAIGVRNMIVDLTTSGGADPEFVKKVARSELLGPERMVWGSDGVFSTLDKIEDKRKQFAEIGLTEDEQEQIMWGTPARLLGLDAQ